MPESPETAPAAGIKPGPRYTFRVGGYPWMPMVPPVADKLPACFLADLIHAQMSTGNFGKMASAAIAYCRQHNRHDDANLFSALQQQVADYFAQSTDDGTISITFRPE